jgi:copper chaperone CopZ
MVMPSDARSNISDRASNDQLALIHIEGMHCHKCEEAIAKVLSKKSGVREVEVDFNSKQASVLYDPGTVKIGELMAAVDEAGYSAVSFTLNNPSSKS